MDTEYLKKVGIFALSVLLSCAVLFYFGYHIWHSFTREIETEAAVGVSYEETIKSEGYIFRTETVLESSGGAKSLVPTADEGEHIRKSGEVAKLYSGFSPDTVARIEELEEQIELLGRYKNTQGASLKDSANIDREIYSVLSDIRGLSDKGMAGGAVALRQSLLASVGERAMLTGGIGNLEGEISALESEKKDLVSQLGSLAGTVYTPVSGYYYSQTDGFENVFRPELLEDISLKELRALLEKEGEAPGGAGKTVTKSLWYLVCPVDVSEKNTYKAGGACSVKFRNTEITVDMDVEQVLYDDSGAMVILSTNKMPTGFDFFRTQEVELVKTEYTGLRVPVSAVRLINGETGVYILDVSVVAFRRVEILYNADNSYYIVKMPETAVTEEEEETQEETEYIPDLRLHDSIIVEGKGLYEGRVIGN